MKKAREAGHILIVNSGRPYRHIEPQIKALGFDGYIRREHSMMEVVVKGLTKAGGMQTVMQRLGVSREDTYAFGDGANDLPMLREAGTGVFMGNAPEKLWKEADYVTSPITEDGLAKALEHFRLI